MVTEDRRLMDLSVSDQSVIISFFQMEIYLQKVAFGIRKKYSRKLQKSVKDYL